ncbi:hypothetical protein KY084_04600 [Stakelama sp. CBK3Z-3]|uniref:HEAT repeat domain-containing protein n=1 Tax=Stakelama flava TaxID=2860338 RepID=A0ABS6XJR3_9SPHN|nr:hypothetical protein [Stakelama flava]MBW4330154.1 hypothetical protein [Stakelama flava]
MIASAPLGALAKRIADAADAGQAAALIEAEFARPGRIGQWLDPMLARLRTDPLYQPPLSAKRDAARTSLLLFESPELIVSATIGHYGATPQPARTITLSGRVQVTAYPSAAGATLHRWRLGGDRLAHAGRFPLADGDIVRCDGRSEGHFVEPAAHGQIVALTAAIRIGALPVLREYSRRDGHLLRTGTADSDASRRQMLLMLLRATGDNRADEAFDHASRHDACFLRWEAMREWLGHDARAALPRLREMAASDPEAMLRASAGEMARRVEARLAEASCPA